MDKFWKWMKKKHGAYFGTNTNNKWMLWYDAEDYIINAIPTKQMLIGYMIEYMIDIEDEVPRLTFGVTKEGGIDQLYNRLIEELKE